MNGAASARRRGSGAGKGSGRRFARAWWVGGWLAVALVVWASLATPPPGALPSFTWADKLAHLVAYAALGWWFGELEPEWRRRAFWGFCAVGAVLELLQGLTPERTPELLDGVANALGAASGALLLAAASRGRVLDALDRGAARLLPGGRGSRPPVHGARGPGSTRSPR